MAKTAQMHFQKYDVDRNGKLEKRELSAILENLGCKEQLGEEKFVKLVKSSIKSFDKDKDGKLDYGEFVQLFNKMQGTIERVQRRKMKHAKSTAVADVGVERHSSGAKVQVSDVMFGGPVVLSACCHI